MTLILQLMGTKDKNAKVVWGHVQVWHFDSCGVFHQSQQKGSSESPRAFLPAMDLSDLGQPLLSPNLSCQQVCEAAETSKSKLLVVKNKSQVSGTHSFQEDVSGEVGEEQFLFLLPFVHVGRVQGIWHPFLMVLHDLSLYPCYSKHGAQQYGPHLGACYKWKIPGHIPDLLSQSLPLTGPLHQGLEKLCSRFSKLMVFWLSRLNPRKL